MKSNKSNFKIFQGPSKRHSVGEVTCRKKLIAFAFWDRVNKIIYYKTNVFYQVKSTKCRLVKQQRREFLRSYGFWSSKKIFKQVSFVLFVFKQMLLECLKNLVRGIAPFNKGTCSNLFLISSLVSG